MGLVIRGGLVISPTNGLAEKLDIEVSGGRILRMQKGLGKVEGVDEIDAGGKIVSPGLIDMNMILREPGREDIGTIKTGMESAAAGGYTGIACMPHTSPVIDNKLGVKYVLSRAKEISLVKVFPIGGLTKGLLGEELSDIYGLFQAGVYGLTDMTIMDANIMRKGFEYCKMYDLPILSYCENMELSKDGCVNEGYVSTLLGFRGIPNIAEYMQVMRDIMLCEFTNSRLHIKTISTKESVEHIRYGKCRGLKLTCEVMPYHLTLTEENLINSNYDTNLKISPPLRTHEDKKALIKGLKEDVIDVIVSGHIPWLSNEKDTEFINAPYGVIGLETTLPLIYTHLVCKKEISLSQMVRKLSSNPAKVLKVEGGELRKGGKADITIIDPNLEIVIGDDFFHSISKNSPYIGKKLKGFATHTIVEGQIVYERATNTFYKRIMA